METLNDIKSQRLNEIEKLTREFKITPLYECLIQMIKSGELEKEPKPLEENIHKMLMAIDSNAGSEFDLEDEYGDHSCYREMLKVVKKSGYRDRRLNLEAIPEKELNYLFNLISRRIKAPSSCIKKFLHLSVTRK